MKFSELNKILNLYSKNIGISKDLEFIGNEYCLVKKELVEDINNLESLSFSFKDLLKVRFNLQGIKSQEDYLKALEKSNVVGVSAKMDKNLRTQVGTITIRSALKLNKEVIVDKRFSNLFSNHTFWYNKNDNKVFAINKETKKIEGLFVKIEEK